MKCFKFDDDMVIAKDQRDAPAVWHEEYGGDSELTNNWEDWEEVPGDFEICISDTRDIGTFVDSKTAAEWVAEKGRGCLCVLQV